MFDLRKMKVVFCALALTAAAFSLFLGPASASSVPSHVTDQGGGTKCAGCAILVGLVEQLAEIYNISIAQSIDKLCGFLPTGFKEICTLLVDDYAAVVIDLLEKKETPDIVCAALKICTKVGGDICHIFPLPRHSSKQELDLRLLQATKRAEATQLKSGVKRTPADICDYPLVKPICNIINRFGNDHLPLEDTDGDYFSVTRTFRGTSWRGKDCDDFHPDIHPGRRSTDDAFVDTNCNGIQGIDANSGRTFESLWCEDSQQMGTVMLGDSAAAHFHIPPSWLTSRNMSIEAFQDLPFILENELDWPMLSSSTGYENTSQWKRDIHGPVDSLYLRMRQVNLCNHRDYQNIAVNGARSSSMASTIVKSLARNGMSDNPVLISFALIGNDVCSGHQDMDHMTTPQEFYTNNLKTFRYLDSVVAPGSKIMAFGLVDGRVLYEYLHNRIHPIGSLRNDVTYAQVYDYLNCLHVSPCFGWMNSNETWRNRTTERAMQLNQALQSMVEKEIFTNFTAHYFDTPLKEAFQRWEAAGHSPYDLIEPVDGFHPSQQAQALIAQVSWEMVRNLTTDFIPPTNPYNDLIRKQFGDQNGY